MVEVGFIGVGAIAKRHFKIFQKIPSANIASVCDLNPAALHEAKKCTGARCYSNLDEMLKKENLDAVYVCVPIRAHGEIEEKVCERGIDLFIEKPLPLVPHTIDRVHNAISRAGVISSVGYEWRYAESTQKAKDMIRDKTVGMVLGFWMTYMSEIPWWSKKQENPAQIYEQTIHLFDLARYLCSDISEVSSRFAMRAMGELSELEDVSVVSVEFENGAIGSMNSTYMISYRHPRGGLGRWINSKNKYLELLSEGTMKLGLWHPGPDLISYKIELMMVLKDLVLRVKHGSLDITQDDRHYTIKSKKDPYQLESEAFIKAVSTGDDSWIKSNYDDAIKTHNTVMAAIESAYSKKPVKINPDYSYNPP